jgi:hypothetical protein
MPCPKPGKKARMLNLVVANTVLKPPAVIFELPPLPVGTFPVCEVNDNKEEPHHGPPRKPFMPLDALEEDKDFDELNVNAIVLDPEEEAEVAEANVVADTDGNAFLVLMEAAQAQQAQLQRAKFNSNRKRSYPGNAPRTKRHYMQVRRKLAMEGKQPFITKWGQKPAEKVSRIIFIKISRADPDYKQPAASAFEDAKTDIGTRLDDDSVVHAVSGPSDWPRRWLSLIMAYINCSCQPSPDVEQGSPSISPGLAYPSSAALTAEEQVAESLLEHTNSAPLMREAPERREEVAKQLFDSVSHLNERRNERTVQQLESLERQLNYQNLKMLRCAKARLAVVVKKPEKLGVVLHARALAMLSTINLFMDEDLKFGWRKASVVAARAQGFTGEKRARNVRTWIHDFIQSGLQKLPIPAYRGNKDSLLVGEDFATNLRLYLLEKRQSCPITACNVANYCLLEEVQQKYSPVSITERTGRRWLHRMQWRYGKTPCGMYIDGHERKDVVQYRKDFVERWYTLYEPWMATAYVPRDKDDEKGEGVYRPGFPVLQGPRFKLILVTHDESTFYAYDRRTTHWIAPGDKPAPIRKGEGPSLMVSDFLTTEWGRLVDDDGKYVLTWLPITPPVSDHLSERLECSSKLARTVMAGSRMSSCSSKLIVQLTSSRARPNGAQLVSSCSITHRATKSVLTMRFRRGTCRRIQT